MENCNYEQSEQIGIPASEYNSKETSAKGRYVDVPADHFGYPGEYEESLEKRKKSYKDSEEAALYNNNQVI